MTVSMSHRIAGRRGPCASTRSRNRNHAGARMPAASRGFSLIELMIVVAIVALLAAIAVPSYSSYLTKARRSDATILLTEAAGEQVRHFSEFNAYTADLSELGYALDDDAPSADGHYTLSATVDANDPSRFLLTATPVAGGLQADDDDCGSFTLNDNGVQGVSGSADNCW